MAANISLLDRCVKSFQGKFVIEVRQKGKKIQLNFLLFVYLYFSWEKTLYLFYFLMSFFVLLNFFYRLPSFSISSQALHKKSAVWFITLQCFFQLNKMGRWSGGSARSEEQFHSFATALVCELVHLKHSPSVLRNSGIPGLLRRKVGSKKQINTRRPEEVNGFNLICLPVEMFHMNRW